MIKQFYHNNLSFLRVSAMLLASLYAGSGYAEQLPQVKAETVQAWHQGQVEQLNCKVSSAYLRQFSSESNAKLNFVLPAASRVKQGDLIAAQDSYYIQKAIEQLQLELTSAKLAVEYHAQEYRRLSGLAEKLVSPSSLNNLALKRDQASSLQLRLQKEIERQHYQAGKLKFFAPANGEVVTLHASPGQFISQGEAILAFLADNDKELKCELPLQTYSSTNGISQSLFQWDSKQQLAVKRISQIVAPDSQMISVFLSLPTHASTPLFLQQRLKVTMQTPATGLSRLPLDSLNLHSDGNFVWQLLANATVHKRAVEIVENQSKYLLVRSTLKPGDQVITIGRNDLTQDQQVSIPGKQTGGSY